MAETSSRKFTTTIIISLTLIIGLSCWVYLSYSKSYMAPNVSLQFIDGRSSTLLEVITGPTLVTFWTTSCKTCVKKTPELKALYKKLNSQGFEIIAVAMSYDPPNQILNFSDNFEIPYPIALDIDGSIAKAFDDVELTPTTFLISNDMKIVMTAIGDINTSELEKKIVKMLALQNSTAVNETS
jgi:peroxiredoxin